MNIIQNTLQITCKRPAKQSVKFLHINIGIASKYPTKSPPGKISSKNVRLDRVQNVILLSYFCHTFVILLSYFCHTFAYWNSVATLVELSCLDWLDLVKSSMYISSISGAVSLEVMTYLGFKISCSIFNFQKNLCIKRFYKLKGTN